jgi:hypothetical protein
LWTKLRQHIDVDGGVRDDGHHCFSDAAVAGTQVPEGARDGILDRILWAGAFPVDCSHRTIPENDDIRRVEITVAPAGPPGRISWRKPLRDIVGHRTQLIRMAQ